MRVGYNPLKDKMHSDNDFYHQVILPVYIPNLEGYFKDSFEILKLCLDSLIITSHKKTYISIVNNGSCREIIDYLQELLLQNKIHELTHSTNIGYINAILKGSVGHKFTLVTTSDADVLFLNNWQKATYDVFENFPKAGAVCPTPSSKSFNYLTFNIIADYFFSKKLKFTSVKNSLALKRFAQSIGNEEFYKSVHLNKILTISENSVKAVVGAGHFVVTYRGDLLEQISDKYTPFILGGNSDDIFDKPVIRHGLWRLSTDNNYTYHLGNVIEPWMQEAFNALKKEDKELDFVLHKSLKRPSSFFFWLKNTLPEKLFYRKPIRRFFLRYKGLTQEEAKQY